MRIRPVYSLSRCAVLLAAICLMGCPPTGGVTGTGDDNGDGTDNGTGNGDGGGQTGGFEDNGLEAPGQLATGVENVSPTGELMAPPERTALARGAVAFRWEATDGNATNLDSTVFVGAGVDVFSNPQFTVGVRTPPEEVEHSLSIQLPDAGTFYWGVQVTDGVNTVQIPANGLGMMFVVSAEVTTIIGTEDVQLLCPRETEPARAQTTFSWSLGATVPTRQQVYVSRAGQDNPFDSPLSVFDVADPTATSRTLSAEEALPIGAELSWGLRIETAEGVQFTFEGQLGNFFLVAENVPPAGVLLSPEEGAVLADNSEGFLFTWAASAGNCEEEVTSTIFLELLGASDEPVALFESDLQLEGSVLLSPTDAEAALTELNLAAGRWAWGVLASDGTDQTALPDSEDPSRTYRTFIRNTGPWFVNVPVVEQQACETQGVPDDVLTFSYADDNGAETVAVNLTFASAEDLVFDGPEATLELTPSETGEGLVFLESVAAFGCLDFVQGAGFYGVELDDTVNDSVRRVVEYTGPPIGACCAPDGNCTEGIFEDCITGVYQGDGITCTEANCPQPPTIPDCNGNLVDDTDDIVLGNSNDCNLNGVPDECEGSPTVVEAGVLAAGAIGQFGRYDSVPNNNDLSGSICPVSQTTQVFWTLESSPLGTEVSITNPTSLTTSYLVEPAGPGVYVFRLRLMNTQLSDTVTLTLAP